MNHPRLLVCNEDSGRKLLLPRVEELRRRGESTDDSYADRLVQSVLRAGESYLDLSPWTPASRLPERHPDEVARGNREFTLVGMTASRILDTSLTALILGRRDMAVSATSQIHALFDRSLWPEIEDQTHLYHGDHCSLRSGQLAFAIGLAYDWLHPLLSSTEQSRIIEGLHDRFVLPFKAALEHGDRWVNFNNNFVTAIYGGFGVAGMALDGEYDGADWLMKTGLGRLTDYVDGLLGAEGEFDESVQYAGSVSSLAAIYMVRRSYEDSDRCMGELPLDQFLEWYIRATLPPGRMAGFGDPGVDLPPVCTAAAAGAAIYGHPVFQWFYQQYASSSLSSHRRVSLEALFYDPTVPAAAPEGLLSHGRAYGEYSGIVTSRDSWDSPTTVVYAKSGTELNHGHADWGQLCIDGGGERLVVDLGSTPGYPRGHKERYYNYQQWGHNIFAVGDPDDGGTPMPDLAARKSGCCGHLVASRFDEELGSCFTFDLSAAYPTGCTAIRSVVHLFPRIVAVFDTLKADEELPISLRWHLAEVPEIDDIGRFAVESGGISLSGIVAVVAGSLGLRVARHQYKPPFDRNAHGEPYEQRREPYLEAFGEATECSVVTLFCVESTGSWECEESNSLTPGWAIETAEGRIVVEWDSAFRLTNARTGDVVEW